MSDDPHLPEETIAVVGLAGRFPGADSIESYWSMLKHGEEGIRKFSASELSDAGVPAEHRRDPAFVPFGGAIEGADEFDAPFFGVSPRDAELMDPQQRVFLEVCHEGLERAGHTSAGFDGRIGVFAGCGVNTYLLFQIAPRPGPDLMRILTANGTEFASLRTSFKLNLTGPSLSVRSTCSSSLVALHLACQSLQLGECDMALAGAVGIRFPMTAGYWYQPGGILSPDGHCRPFDARAAGTVFGNGAGVVVLRRLQEALDDSDTVLAVIRGSAINNDGAHKPGFTAPSISGQAQAVAEAHLVADVAPETLSYIEAHGTGTSLGDPIEISALREALGSGLAPNSCALGSVKGNIGHLDVAAGIAGFIKVVLSLQHELIPPSLHFSTPNPHIDFSTTPFYVNRSLAPWPRTAQPRRAGVSAFGFGGTNAHVVLEEAPSEPTRPPPQSRSHLLVVSAKTPTALQRASLNLADALDAQPELSLADVAFTLQRGRQPFACRRTVVARTSEGASAKLRATSPGETVPEGAAPLVFLFTGQGAQYPNMARSLYEQHPVFRATVDLCASQLQDELNLDLRHLLFPEPGRHDPRLYETAFVQPSLFTIEYALTQLWASWGIRPAAVLGHSVGELVAACVAGVMDLPSALRLIATRGKLMQACPSGAMLAVAAPAEVLRLRLPDGVSVASINGAESCVVSGSEPALTALAAVLDNDAISSRRLKTNRAFHSSLVEPTLDRFLAAVSSVHLSDPELPLLSNVTGTWAEPGQLTRPEYWVDQLRHTVQFQGCITAAHALDKPLFLEVGPGRTLAQFVKRHNADAPVFTSLPKHDDDADPTDWALSTLGELWQANQPVDWTGLYAEEKRRRVCLPTYPFERKRYWLEPQSRGPAASTSEGTCDLVVPRWLERASESPAGNEEACLVFAPDPLGADAWAEALQSLGKTVTVVLPGPPPAEDAGVLWLDPGDPSQLADLLARFEGKAIRAVYLWGLGACEGPATERISWMERFALTPLLQLAQALWASGRAQPTRLEVVTRLAHAVTPGETVRAEMALLSGACQVISQQVPHMSCRAVDVDASCATGDRGEPVALDLLHELSLAGEEPVVAFRQGRCLALGFAELAPAATQSTPLQHGGTYVITGGLGGIGLEIAEHLATHWGANVVLTSRSELPPSADWEAVVGDSSVDASRREILARLLRIAGTGVRVLPVQADVTQEADMERLAATLRQEFGSLDGVIHAAGLASGGLLHAATPEELHDVVSVKAVGAVVVEETLGPLRPAFILHCSSLAAIIGEAALEYCAANAFLDAFAAGAQARGAPFTVSVNWPAWRDTGMRRLRDAPAELRRDLEEVLVEGISVSQATDVFFRTLQAGQPQVAALPPDTPASLRDLFSTPRIGMMAPSSLPPVGDYAGNDAVEREVLGLFREALGSPAFGVDDDFFSFGGDSLTAVQLVSQISKAFNVTLRLETFMTARSVRQIAHYVHRPDSLRKPRPDLSVPFREPDSDLAVQIAAVWEDVLNVAPIGVDDDFFGLGGDSLQAVDLGTRLQRALSLELEVEDVMDARTVQELCDIIASPTKRGVARPKQRSLLIPIQPGTSDVAVFCMPGAGGAVFCYHAFARRLGTEQSVYGLQARGLNAGELPHTHVEDIAASNLVEVRRVQPRGPYALVGYSFGGVVALEMAQQLHAAGDRVALLAALDSPLSGDGLVGMSDEELLYYLSNGDPELHPDILRRLTPEQQYLLCYERMGPQGVLPPDFSAEQIARFVAVLKANSRAAILYNPLPFSGAPIHYFSASERDLFSSEELVLPWIDIATNGLRVQRVDGSHLVLLNEPHVASLAPKFSAVLRDAVMQS